MRLGAVDAAVVVAVAVAVAHGRAALCLLAYKALMAKKRFLFGMTVRVPWSDIRELDSLLGEHSAAILLARTWLSGILPFHEATFWWIPKRMFATWPPWLMRTSAFQQMSWSHFCFRDFLWAIS